MQPQQAKRRPGYLRQPQRDYGNSALSGARYNARPGGAQANPPRRYSFWRGGGGTSTAKGSTRLTEIPIITNVLREAHDNSDSMYMFDGADTPHFLEEDQLFMLA